MGRTKVKTQNHKWDEKWLTLAAKVMAMGLSADRVAKSINNVYKVNITRNAVIGRINRMRAVGDTRFDNLPPAEKINGKSLNFLFEAWENGIGANEIADYYGIHRNTVSKKAAEYGLSQRTAEFVHNINREKRGAKKPAAVSANIYKPMDKFINPNARKIEFLELKRNQCHFPIGDGPFLFCGADVELGSSTPYCSVCKSIVYRPSQA